MKDLFETPELMPEALSEIFNRWESLMMDGLSYEQIASLMNEVESVGYTFDYYLDADPYGLRPMGTELHELEGWENI